MTSSLCLLLLVPTLAAADTPPVGTLTIHDGVLYRDGKPFRAFGLNVRDLADDVLDKGAAAKESFDTIALLGEKKVPFIRFWASYFDNRKKFLADPDRYWKNMDLLIDACEKAHVGLAPTLFWDSWNVPWTFGEYCKDWGDPTSQTRAFMERYTKEFVERYRGRSAIWFYEFSNENNLAWDLPNAMEFLKGHQDARNVAHWEVGRDSIAAFGRAVRALDPWRPLSSGCSQPRGCQWHLANFKAPGSPWETDTPEQTAIAAGWTAPDPVDLLCIHSYMPHLKYDGAKTRAEIAQYSAIAKSLGRPLYVGEWGVLDGDGKLDATFDDQLYMAHARDFCQVLYENKVPLCCWWDFSPKGWGYGMGAADLVHKRFNWVLDMLAEYNAKIAAE